MTVSYNDILATAKTFLRENRTRIVPEDWNQIAEHARQQFSKDKPQDLIADVTGNGTSVYPLTSHVGPPIITGLTSWTAGVSTIRSLEYPVSTTGEPEYVDRNEFMIYRPASGKEQLRLLGSSPTASETLRVRYTAPHSFSVTTSTIDDLDRGTFSLLAAAYAAQLLAADFLKSNTSNLSQDNSDFSQKSRDMQSLADSLFKKYASAVSSKTDGAKSYTTAIKDLDMKGSIGQSFLFHPERFR